MTLLNDYPSYIIHELIISKSTEPANRYVFDWSHNAQAYRVLKVAMAELLESFSALSVETDTPSALLKEMLIATETHLQNCNRLSGESGERQYALFKIVKQTIRALIDEKYSPNDSEVKKCCLGLTSGKFGVLLVFHNLLYIITAC